MTNLCVLAEGDGAILCDTGIAAQLDRRWFVPSYWSEQGKLGESFGGRGSACLVRTPVGDCVLRHFLRGGRVATMLGDRYLWTGSDSKTRSFAEYHLLRDLRELDLPVPDPIAAQYRRAGMHYTADILTRRLDGATLARLWHDAALDSAVAFRVGATIGCFHRHGVYHADLNAHNILVDADQVHLLDFDRGEMRAPAPAWQQANLARLRRSLIKLASPQPDAGDFEAAIWTPLMQGHESAATPSSATDFSDFPNRR